jgi:hypothetical protein
VTAERVMLACVAGIFAVGLLAIGFAVYDGITGSAQPDWTIGVVLALGVLVSVAAWRVLE